MRTIEHRRLGASNIIVPAMGNGTLAWGEKRFGYGKTYTRDDLFTTYKAFLDAGLNFFDTSDTYGKGLSEELLGEFHHLDGRPIIVSTKFTQAKPYDPNTNFSSEAVMPVLDRSLKRLQLDSVDLYMLHYPPARRKIDRYLDALAETIKSGKAKAIGVSNFNTELFIYSHEYLTRQHSVPLSVNQVGYNLLHRQPETNGMLQACQDLDVALIAILPLAEGVLTGKYRVGGAKYSTVQSGLFRGTKLFEPGESIIRTIFTKPYEMQRKKLEPLLKSMDEIAHKHDVTIAQVALNWLIASNPHVIPIPGAKSLKQATSNAATLSWKMTQDEFEKLSQTEATIRNSLKRQ